MPGALILVQLPLFAMGLGRGLTASLIACATATLIVLAAVPLPVAGLFILLGAAPVAVLTYLALQSRPVPGGVEWYPPGYLLAWLGAISFAYLVLTGLYFSGTGGGMEPAAYEFLKSRLGVVLAGMDPEQLEVIARLVARLFPATALGLWQITVIVGGILAQGLMARFNRNIRPGVPFFELELPRWATVLLVVCAAAALVPGQIGYIGRNGVIITALPFFFLGLSVIHAVSRQWSGRVFVLLGMYLLTLIFGWPAVIVAGLGFVEQWLGLRRRYAGRRPNQEEE